MALSLLLVPMRATAPATAAVLHCCKPQPVSAPLRLVCSRLSSSLPPPRGASSRRQSTASRPFPSVTARPALSPSPFPAQRPAPATFPSYESGVSASRDFTSSIVERLSEYSRLPQRGVTLEQLMAVGERPSPLALLASAQFLAQQLPIRLAKRVMELDSLPYGLSQTPAVQTVKGWYKLSFKSPTASYSPHCTAQHSSTRRCLQVHSRRSLPCPSRDTTGHVVPEIC